MIKASYRGSAVLLLLAASLPYFVDMTGHSIVIPVLTLSWIMGIYAVSFSLLLSQLGLLSFGHALYFGLGAYTTIYAVQWAGIPYPLALLISAGLGALLGFLVSLAVRNAFGGIPFAFITLAIQLIIYLLFRKREFSWLSGGEQGLVIGTPQMLRDWLTSLAVLAIVSAAAVAILALPLIRRGLERTRPVKIAAEMIICAFLLYAIWSWTHDLAEMLPALRATRNLYLVSLVFLVIVYVITSRLFSSPVGTIWKAIRDNETRASALGYNVFTYKSLALAISGSLAAFAGSLYVPYTLNVNPEKVLSPTVSIYALIYSIVGGLGSPLGPILGSLLVNTLEIYLSPYFGGYGPVMAGLVFIAVMLTSPGGLTGLLLRLRRNLKPLTP